MIAKRKLFFLLSIPLIATLAFFGPSGPEGWKSACGCIPTDWNFVIYLQLETEGASFPDSVDLDKLGSDKVASGFLRKVPIGSSLQEIEETSRGLESSCEEVNVRMYQCDYWLQFKRTSARGYSVLFHLSESRHLQSLEARAVRRERGKVL